MYNKLRKTKIRTTRQTGGLLRGYKPLLLGLRLKARAFSLCYMGKLIHFPTQLRSSHIAIDPSLPLKGRLYYLKLTLERVLILLHAEFIQCYIMFFLVLNIFLDC